MSSTAILPGIVIGITVVGFTGVITTIGYAYRHLASKLDLFNSHVVRSAVVEAELRQKLTSLEVKSDKSETERTTLKENVAVLASELERHLSWHERHPGQGV
jgi:hypothetical protein